MTIDGVIKGLIKEAKQVRDFMPFWKSRSEKHYKELEEFAKYYEQLAEWLTELKELKNSIGAVKLSNMKEALALIRTLKAELNGWKDDPFSIIAEVCGAATDCRRCQWYEKCPFPKNYGSYPEEWRKDEHS